MSRAIRLDRLNVYNSSLLWSTLVVLAILPHRVCDASEGYSIEGFSRPNRIAEVAASTSGVVSELLVVEGAAVAEGDCLCRLDSEVHDALLKIAEATKESAGELKAAKAEFESASRRLKSLQELASRNHSSEEELQRARSGHELAAANLQIAEEKKRLRLADFEKMLAQAQQYQIRAPFDGVVVEFHKEKGEYVGPVEPRVCTVAELDVLSVDFLLSRNYRNEVDLERDVTVHFTESNREITGRIYYISPYPDAETSTYMVKVRVDNASRSLNAGERCLFFPGVESNTASAPPARVQLIRTR